MHKINPPAEDLHIQICVRPHNESLRVVPEGDKAFLFRDPVGRFISGFNSRQRRRHPRYASPWSDAEAAALAEFKTQESISGSSSCAGKS